MRIIEGYQPDRAMTPEEIANPPKSGSGLCPYYQKTARTLGNKVTMSSFPSLNLIIGEKIRLDGIKYRVIRVFPDGAELEKVEE